MDFSSIKTALVAVAAADVKAGDTIYISNKENSVPYYVLQAEQPFALIENTRTHFASLYRLTGSVYKEQKID